MEWRRQQPQVSNEQRVEQEEPKKENNIVAVPCRRRSRANMGRLDFEVDRYAYNPQTPRLK